MARKAKSFQRYANQISSGKKSTKRFEFEYLENQEKEAEQAA